jgi:HK97 family phage major capsid protein
MDRQFLIRDLKTARAQRERSVNEIAKLEAFQRSTPDDGVAERLGNLRTGAARADEKVIELEDKLGRYEALERGAANPRQHEAGTSYSAPAHPARVEAADRRGGAFREAQHVLEEHIRSGEMTTMAADAVDECLRGDDLRVGEAAQWVASHGQPAYRTAFLKAMQYGESCWARFDADEIDAMQQAMRSEQFRAMAEGTGSAGGFGLPISIDPTILLASNGAINPVRSLATVRSVGAYQLRLVTTDPNAVSAAYAQEGTEVGDNSPTLVQPVLTPHRWHEFVPYSYELGMDYPGLQAELLKLMADARDMLEAQVFLNGNPTSFQPAGILNVGGTGSLTTSQQVQTATTATLAAADIYTLRTSVPPRWLLESTWLMAPAQVDTTYRLVPRASSTEPVLMSDDRTTMLGAKVDQWSTMDSGSTTGKNIVLWGDFSQYVIADRIGLTALTVPVLFGANRRPTGQAGIYVWGRTDAAVAVPNAIRYLSVK